MNSSREIKAAEVEEETGVEALLEAVLSKEILSEAGVDFNIRRGPEVEAAYSKGNSLRGLPDVNSSEILPRIKW
jgi:hypothetical protein